MTLDCINLPRPAALVHEGCDALHGTGCVCTARPTPDYVELTRVAGWYDGERRTVPVYVNRRHVTHVIGGPSVTVHFIGDHAIEVTESVECVVEALER